MGDNNNGEIIFKEEYAIRLWNGMQALSEKTLDVLDKLNFETDDFLDSGMKGECAKEFDNKWLHLSINIDTAINQMISLKMEVINAAKKISNVDVLAATQIQGK